MSNLEEDTEKIRDLLGVINAEIGRLRDTAAEINRGIKAADAGGGLMAVRTLIIFALLVFTFASVPTKEQHLQFATSKADLTRIQDSMSRYDSNWFISYTKNESGLFTTIGIFGRVVESEFR